MRLISKRLFLGLPTLLKSGFRSKMLLYVFLFGLSYLFFFACNYIDKTLYSGISNINQQLNKYGYSVKNVSWSLWARTIHIENLQNLQSNIILADNLQLELGIWSKSIMVEAGFGQGKVEAEITFDSLFDPKNLAFEAKIKDSNIGFLGQLLGNSSNMPIQIEDGIFSGIITGEMPLSTPINFRHPQYLRNILAQSRGKIEMNLEESQISHHIPMLKDSTLKDLQAEAQILWDKLKLKTSVLIKNDVLQITESGQYNVNLQNIAMSSLSSLITTKIDSSRLHQELVPSKTMAEINRQGSVTVQLSQTFRKPTVQIQ